MFKLIIRVKSQLEYVSQDFNSLGRVFDFVANRAWVDEDFIVVASVVALVSKEMDLFVLVFNKL